MLFLLLVRHSLSLFYTLSCVFMLIFCLLQQSLKDIHLSVDSLLDNLMQEANQSVPVSSSLING